MIHVLRLGSMEYGIFAITSECEADRRCIDELLCSIKIAKGVIFTLASKLAVAKQFEHACSLALDLHRLIIPISRPSCQLSTFRKCVNSLTFIN